MDQATHNKIVSFIWGIADDVLRDLFKRGKHPVVTGKLDVRPAARHLPTEPLAAEPAPDPEESSEPEETP